MISVLSFLLPLLTFWANSADDTEKLPLGRVEALPTSDYDSKQAIQESSVTIWLKLPLRKNSKNMQAVTERFNCGTYMPVIMHINMIVS